MAAIKVKLLEVTLRYVEFGVMNSDGNIELFKKLTKAEFIKGVINKDINIVYIERACDKTLPVPERLGAIRMICRAIDCKESELPFDVDSRADAITRKLVEKLRETHTL